MFDEYSLGVLDGSEQSNDLEILGIVGCILYIVLLFFSLGSLFVVLVMRRRFVRTLPGAHSTSTNDERKHRASVLFHIIVIIFMASRAWMFFDLEEGVGKIFIESDGEYNVPDIIDVWVRKIGYDFHYTTYTIIIYWWVVSYSRSFRASNRSSVETAKGILIFLNVVMIAITFLFVLVYSITNGSNAMKPVYYYVTSLLDIILSVAVPILAIFVYNRQKDEVWFLRAERHDMLRILWCSGVFFLCNLVRSIFPVYYVITGKKNKHYLLAYLFTYIVPETISTLLQLYILHAKNVSKVHDARLIESLYYEARQSDGPGTMRAPLLNVNKEVTPVTHLYNTVSSSSSSSSGSSSGVSGSSSSINGVGGISVPYRR